MPDTAPTPLPIPIHLADYPTIGGLVVPYIAVRHLNGDAAIGLVDHERVVQCLRERRCSVCGEVMQGRMVFLMRQADLVRKRSAEPGLCPPCAAYTQTVCPMVSGRMAHYRQTASPFIARKCGDSECPCRQWAPQSEPARFGAQTGPWYALWIMQYRLIEDDNGNLAAGFAGLHVLALREIARSD